MTESSQTSLFFLWRMKTFVDKANALMGGADTETQWFLRHPQNLWSGAVVTLVILFFNLRGLWYR